MNITLVKYFREKISIIKPLRKFIGILHRKWNENEKNNNKCIKKYNNSKEYVYYDNSLPLYSRHFMISLLRYCNTTSYT